MGRPKEYDEGTRERLLAHAGEILETEGVERLSVRHLAARAGTTTRAIYSLFDGKDGLLAAMYRQMARDLAERHAEVARREDEREELLALALAYRESARAHPRLYSLVVFGRPGFTPTDADMQLARSGYVRAQETLERGVRSGAFRGRSADRMGRQLWALLHGLTTSELAGALGEPDEAERHWRDAVLALLRGYASRP